MVESPSHWIQLSNFRKTNSSFIHFTISATSHAPSPPSGVRSSSSVQKFPGKAATAATPSSRTRSQADSAMTTDVALAAKQREGFPHKFSLRQAAAGKPQAAGEALKAATADSGTEALEANAAQALARTVQPGRTHSTNRTRTHPKVNKGGSRCAR